MKPSLNQTRSQLKLSAPKIAFPRLFHWLSYTRIPLFFFRLTHEAGATSMIGKRSFEKFEGRKRKVLLFEIQ